MKFINMKMFIRNIKAMLQYIMLPKTQRETKYDYTWKLLSVQKKTT